MDNIIKKTITITEITPIKSKTNEIIGINLVDENGVKYSVWNKKQDGTPTKASLQIKSKALGYGSEVGIAYDEFERTYTFTGKDGKEHQGKSVNRNIKWFADNEQEKFTGGYSQEDSKYLKQTEELAPLLVDGEEVRFIPKEEQEEEFDISQIPF